MSNQSPERSQQSFDQSGQTVIGPQTNVVGNVNMGWPRIATLAALIALLAFALLLLELAYNWVARISGLSLQTLLISAAVIGTLAWCLALTVIRMKRNVGDPIGYHKRNRKHPLDNQVPAFGGWYQRLARFMIWAIPALTVVTAIAYYSWIILPARYTTILLADFVTPTGVDEALVTQSLATAISQTLAEFPTLRLKRLHQVIIDEDGSTVAKRIGSQPQHKATVVIWGNYAIPEGDPEVHLHFDIVQPADTYLASGFATSYGPGQISQLLQVDQPTMFDFKVSLGAYLGQMSAFTVGLTLYNANRHNEAIPLLATAGQAIEQPLAADFVRAIRFYRGINYLFLGRAQDAASDLHALAPALTDGATIDELSLAALGNLGIVALLQGDYATAKDYLQQVLVLNTQLSNRLGQAVALGNLGLVARNQGDYAAAKDYLQQALALHSQLGHPLGQATDLGNLGMLALDQGDSTTARAYLDRSAALYQSMGLSLPPAFQAGLDTLASQ